MLNDIIPRILKCNQISVDFMCFSGKQDLQKKIQHKLARYYTPHSVFLVMCDKDFQECKDLKYSLVHKVAKEKRAVTKIRIACHELESFYLGDLYAVGQAFDLPKISDLQQKKNYRDPDSHADPVKLLKSITNNKYQKVSGSRSIAPFLDLDGHNTSKSFAALLSAIQYLGAELFNHEHT